MAPRITRVTRSSFLQIGMRSRAFIATLSQAASKPCSDFPCCKSAPGNLVELLVSQEPAAFGSGTTSNGHTPKRRLWPPRRRVEQRIAGHRGPFQVVGNGPVVDLPSGPDGNCHQAAYSAEDQRRPIASSATCHFAHRECGGSSQAAAMSCNTYKRHPASTGSHPGAPVSKPRGLAFLPRSKRLCRDHIPVTVAA